MKICIDPGHNYRGADSGAVGRKSREQDNTFAVAVLLKSILEQAGHSVMLTRPFLQSNLGGSVSESLQLRVKTSNDFGADIFVSIHNNSGGGIGTETFICAAGGNAEKYAYRIQAEFARLRRIDRGVKIANFAVLRNTHAPAVLVEVGFIDNAEEEEWMLEHPGKIAQAIAKGLGVEPVEDKQKTPWYNDAQWWVKNFGIADGARPEEPATRAEVWQMLMNFASFIGK